ncbi:histone-like nucleoid-structuring protein Lsr2 [Nocardioides xinjiangensis]|uniref:histone-like nucleoid-structuring protein Lsr2 n=1 Tax=Nocardioides xinjiangensis TaxID=2817376 RepID=UPI001B316CFF|nr:Lsr2 family protein [Nocardioides sp. SYSU D00514]
MAQKVNIVLVDDLDGSEATETVTFGLDGTTYEIDLNDANAAALREVLSGYVGHARKVAGGGRRGRRSSGGSSSSSGGSNGSGSAHTREVREWAKSQGMEVSERGRISAEVQQAYDAAH